MTVNGRAQHISGTQKQDHYQEGVIDICVEWGSTQTAILNRLPLSKEKHWAGCQKMRASVRPGQGSRYKQPLLDLLPVGRVRCKHPFLVIKIVTYKNVSKNNLVV